MARSHFTLAALATSAVDGLDVRGAARLGSGPRADFDSALITTADDRQLVVQIPLSERAETEQSADLVALRALSAGIRSRLPFAVPSFAGQTPVDGTRAVVYDSLPGAPLVLRSLRAGTALAESVGRSVAAIHMLPTSCVTDAGLPVLAPVDALRAASIVVDRATATNLVPAALVERWRQAADDGALWQFAPTVIGGGLAAESFLVADDQVVAVQGWHGLSVGDPARDLFWVLGSNDQSVGETVFAAYSQTRGASDRQLAKRARLYAELEVARWLLHGTQQRDTSIVDDAVQMLHGLVDRVQNNLSQTITHNTMPVMAVDEVEAMLDERGRQSLA